MNNFTIGFLYYLKERNMDMDLNNPKKFAEQCKMFLREYTRKYPKGLTNLGKPIKFD